MNELVLVVVCILCVVDVLLIVLRFKLYHGQPPMPILETGACKTIGLREVQEDSFEVVSTAAGTLAVLADGMGKSYGGRAAGRLAVETFTDLFQSYNAFDNPLYYFRRAFQAANREILNHLDEQRGSASVAAALVQGNKLFYALVGNIRIAVYHDGDLIPVSDGHTINKLAEQHYTEGSLTRQDAIKLLERHRLYNYVGQDGFRDIELFDAPWPLRPGDTAVLLSDGVYECLGWREIEEILSREKSCEKTALEIVQAVNQSADEEKDNASVVLLRYGQNAKKRA